MPELKKKEIIYSGKIIKLYREEWEEEGKFQLREVIEHPGAAAVFPVEGDTVYLVKQFRHATRNYFLEIPAGIIDEGETPEETAVRETMEEVGAEVLNIEKLAEVFSSPGFTNEILHLYLAEVKRVQSIGKFDEDEHLVVVPVKLKEFYSLIEEGEIRDSKTLIAGLLYKERLKKTQNEARKK